MCQVERSGTMAETAAEGEALVGGEELGGTRAETAAKEAAKEEETPAPTKTTTMAETTKEAKELLDGEEVSTYKRWHAVQTENCTAPSKLIIMMFQAANNIPLLPGTSIYRGQRISGSLADESQK